MLLVGVVREVEPRDVHARVDHRLDRVGPSQAGPIVATSLVLRMWRARMADLSSGERSSLCNAARPRGPLSGPLGSLLPILQPRGRPDDPAGNVAELRSGGGASGLCGGWGLARGARDRARTRDDAARVRRGDRAGPRARARGRRAARDRRVPALAVAGTAIFASPRSCSGSPRGSRSTAGTRATTAARSPRDRWLGGGFGAIRGALLALLVVYVAMWFDALRATGTAALLPEIGESAAADVTSEVVESAVATRRRYLAAAGRFAARVAARPAASASELKAVLDDPDSSGCATTPTSGATSSAAISTRRSTARAS